MITRKVQFRNGSWLTVIPLTFADVLGLEPGDEIKFTLEGNKIIIEPLPTDSKPIAEG